MSLIGAISMNSIVGLVATSHATALTHGRPMRRLIQYVANVNTPPASGTIQNIGTDRRSRARSPINIGSPGA
jgi:hypothetical protein